jgi:hypothetical protein
MHKKGRPDKKTGARNRKQAASASSRGDLEGKQKIMTIKKLLATGPALRQLASAIPMQQSWVDWLRTQVDVELAPHIVSVVPRNGELVVFADSAAWAVRLRYALAAMATAIAGRDAAIVRTRVRLQPPRTAEPPPTPPLAER